MNQRAPPNGGSTHWKAPLHLLLAPSNGVRSERNKAKRWAVDTPNLLKGRTRFHSFFDSLTSPKTIAVVSMMFDDCSIVGEGTPFETLKPSAWESELSITAAEEPPLPLETDSSKRDDRSCWSAWCWWSWWQLSGGGGGGSPYWWYRRASWNWGGWGGGGNRGGGGGSEATAATIGILTMGAEVRRSNFGGDALLTRVSFLRKYSELWIGKSFSLFSKEKFPCFTCLCFFLTIPVSNVYRSCQCSKISRR